ncbi:hypothetical protein AN964_24180 [Heyndrickxia shackletonii]|uniref:DUF3231 family protein n=1 Tax=Heyndrickxia shackletonii TaxID=157838 RepID=A0A0Q3WPM3_9BACI|nr:DUF3231 family protein [Heyndrickxia shackletonii]KQL50727.1 hypothetical protein AN964_24180 [Heyndrickxia shackletonii]MBB2480365.1 DUF3231 family protein [Bacillus sp. APMAM]NEZ02497.1 DUF3231 family protein [Heyndrickxia shackletonii]RTZ56254.1 DUF3231 family protein [Bacillus sp. SAJ1]
MTNLFESTKDFFKTLIDCEEKNPLHVGEVNSLWVLLTMLEEGISVYQIGLNTTNDDDLIHALKNGEQSSKAISNQLRTFFKKEGIPLPDTSEEKPKSDPNSIPLGVKYTDEELANLVSVKVAAQITLIGQALAMSVRSDSCELLLQIQYELLKYGSSFKTLMRRNGWIKVPPYYYTPGAPGS